MAEEQAGPTEVLLRFHNRHAHISRYEIKAEAVDRIVEQLWMFYGLPDLGWWTSPTIAASLVTRE